MPPERYCSLLATLVCKVKVNRVHQNLPQVKAAWHPYQLRQARSPACTNEELDLQAGAFPRSDEADRGTAANVESRWPTSQNLLVAMAST